MVMGQSACQGALCSDQMQRQAHPASKYHHRQFASKRSPIEDRNDPSRCWPWLFADSKEIHIDGGPLPIER